MRLPLGFLASGVAAGIKTSGQPDLALLYAPLPLAWALVTTQNAVKAPFISRNRALYDSDRPVRAVVVNSGNANCATGDEGARDNEVFAAQTATALGLTHEEVLTASTGIVGKRLPVARILARLPSLKQGLAEGAEVATKAIMTTDTRPKLAQATLPGGARIVGIAKGSGMIHPDMATMLAFVMTDAAVPQARLRALWPRVMDETLNQVTVDGDTSPNDMAVVLATAKLEASLKDVADGLKSVCQALARAIACDGEGATKLITVTVHGARDSAEARLGARAVAKSPLVKAAAYGNDPNWGRILVALGYSGATLDAAQVSIKIQGVEVYRGLPLDFDAGSLAKRMNHDDLHIEVDLAAGNASSTAWGCDLTADYVRINADYHT